MPYPVSPPPTPTPPEVESDAITFDEWQLCSNPKTLDAVHCGCKLVERQGERAAASSDHTCSRCGAWNGGSTPTKSNEAIAHAAKAELGKEMPCAPALFMSIRSALAAVSLKELVFPIWQDLQAKFYRKRDIEMLEFLPVEYWPDSWWFDGATRAKPKFRNIAVVLMLAPCWHREDSQLYEKLIGVAMYTRGETKIPKWPGLFIQVTSPNISIYGDDLMSCSTLYVQVKHCESFDEGVFTGSPQSIGSIGEVQYDRDGFDIAQTEKARGGDYRHVPLCKEPDTQGWIHT